MRILVPTDFSASANNAVKYAIQFAQKTGREIIFFHSVYSLIDDERLGKSYPKEYAKLKIKAETKIRKEVEKISKKLSVRLDQKKISFIIRFDVTPIEDILSLASKKKVDLVIMGTHGATGLRKVLWGSNTSYIISKAPVPVLAIPTRHAYHPLTEIIYAADLENADAELKLIKPMAKKLNVKINSVHFDYGWAKDKNEINNELLLERSKTNYHSHKISLEVPLIKPLDTYMKKRTHAVLCMFHSSKKGFAKLLMGSSTEDISMHLNMPLLSIQKPK